MGRKVPAQVGGTIAFCTPSVHGGDTGDEMQRDRKGYMLAVPILDRRLDAPGGGDEAGMEGECEGE